MERIINRLIEKQIKEVLNLLERIEQLDKEDFAKYLADNIIDRLDDFFKREYELLMLIYDDMGANNV